MKKLERLKLNQLSREELKKRELNQLKGGTGECCGCYYQFENGAGTAENYSANIAQGYSKSYGGNVTCGTSIPSGPGTC